MNNKIKIKNKLISSSSPVFIIAEIGVNYNGDLGLAKKMILKAKECGADCVKIQTFKADEIVTLQATKAHYQKKTTNKDETQFEMLKKLETSDNDLHEIIKFCKKNNIILISTPYTIKDVDKLNDLNFPAFKIASMHLTEKAFLKYIIKKNKPIFLSTGMSQKKEIDEVVKLFNKKNKKNLVLLQCTTNYPTKHSEANILAMKSFSDNYNTLVGFSDHTEDDICSIAAVSLGAVVIEKHFTLNKKLKGPDHTCSYTPKEFKNFVKKIRITESSLGSYEKHITKSENKNIISMKRSIVAICDIKKNTKIDKKMIGFKRPFTGISPNEVNSIIGKRAKIFIKKNSLLKWKDIGK